MTVEKSYTILEYVESLPREILFSGFKIEYHPNTNEYTLTINALDTTTCKINTVQLNKFQLPTKGDDID